MRQIVRKANTQPKGKFVEHRGVSLKTRYRGAVCNNSVK